MHHSFIHTPELGVVPSTVHEVVALHGTWCRSDALLSTANFNPCVFRHTPVKLPVTSLPFTDEEKEAPRGSVICSWSQT